MVRFIIEFKKELEKYEEHIYIPIWLDLLYLSYNMLKPIVVDLHSNMVRFIILFATKNPQALATFTFQYG